VEIPFARRGTRAVEQIDLMKRLWREDHVSHQGQFYKTTDLSIGPCPVQEPHPPIWMGGGAEAVLKRAGRNRRRLYLRHGVFEALRFYLGKNCRGGIRKRPGSEFDKESWNHLSALDENKSRAVASCEAYRKDYYGKVNFDVEAEAVAGPAEICVERLSALFDKGIETLILRLVIPDLRQLDMLAEKVLPRLHLS
jgi:alkanesulfonate monooxygenase SsuD/methylene tetrahydromethanopterin reductase-like flavin-dependent oxidoreductase (luciferase family)